MRLISKIIGNQEKPVSANLSDVSQAITLNGNPLSFSTDSAQISSNTVITLEPIQAGSGDPSPSNVRAISGYDKVDIIASEKNLCKPVEKGGYYYSTGVFDSLSINTWCHAKANIQAGKTYTASFDKIAKHGIIYFNASGARVDSMQVPSPSTNNFTITAPANTAYAVIQTEVSASQIGYIQLEEGSSASLYNPATDISIAMPGTVYGGTLDVESGKLVVDKAVIDLGSLTWASNTLGNPNMYMVSSALPDNLIPVVDYDGNNHFVLEKYHSSDWGRVVDSNDMYGLVYRQIAAGDNRMVCLTDSGSPTGKLIYSITPITYQLSPHQVKLLQGANVVTTNGTSIQLTYRDGDIAKLSDITGLADSVNSLAEIKYRVIAEANPDGIKTNRQALNELYTAYNSLSSGDKLRSFMVKGDTTKFDYVSDGIYSHTHVQGTDLLVTRTLRILNGSSILIEAQNYTTIGFRIVDYSTFVLDVPLRLMVEI